MRYAVLLVRVLPRSRVLDYTPIQTRVMRLGARASMLSPLFFFLSTVFSCSFSSFAPRSQSFGDRPAIERVRRVFEAPCEFPGVISFYLTLQILPNILRTGSTVFTHRVFVETHTFHSLFSLLTSLSLSPSYIPVFSFSRHSHEEESDVSPVLFYVVRALLVVVVELRLFSSI